MKKLFPLLLAVLLIVGCSPSQQATKPDNIPDLPAKDVIQKKGGEMPKVPQPGK
jgi:hypothetical protein